MATEMYRVLERNIIDAKQIRRPLLINDNGAFAPDLENDEAALTLLDASIRDAGYEGKIKIALDVAASAFYKEGFAIYSKDLLLNTIILRPYPKESSCLHSHRKIRFSVQNEGFRSH